MTRFLKNLRLWKKFALLALLALVLAGVPTVFYAVTAMRTVALARAETAGVPPLRAVMQLERLVQQHRGLSSLLLGSNIPQPTREAKQAEVSAALRDVEASLAGDRHLPGVPDLWQTAQSGWAALAPKVASSGISADESFAQHTALIKALMELAGRLGHHHGLWLDHDADAHYLIVATLQDLPRLTEQMGLARAKGALYLNRYQASAEEKVELGGILSIADEQLDGMEANLSNAFAASPELRAALEARSQSLLKKIRAAFKLTRDQVVRSDSLFSVSGTQYFETYTQTIDEAYGFGGAAFEELGKLLDARVRHVVLGEAAMLGAMLAIFVLVALLAHMIVRSITSPAAHAVRLARALAQGKLTERVDAGSRDEMGEMLAALGEMRDSLVAAISAIRSSADRVGEASNQIAAGNHDLSSRTEEQASTLEETASSMEELTTTVKQNADSAREANRLAIDASEVARQGGAAMGEVVSTMNNIADSSGKISDIVGVIDGIAFQTNILALNAAVEAARAGEQGRGFAVVASEVRALAQRSAAAAKEIKALIEGSVARVQGGTQRVEGAGETMSKIVAAVKQVTDITGEIAAASAEQLHGIEQVNRAVAQMDQATQQNASLVEESAAAAEEMANQAAELVAAVARFQTGEAQEGGEVLRLSAKRRAREVAIPEHRSGADLR
jgi:methyl-accepting chemotaxis protein